MKRMEHVLGLALVALLCQLPVSLAVNHLYNADTTEAYDCQLVTLSNSLKAFNTLLGNGNTSDTQASAATSSATATSSPAGTTDSSCNPLTDAKILTDVSGTIASPGYYEGQNYPEDSTCGWLIRTDPGSVLTLQLRNMIIEMDLDCYCTYDSLMIHDGADPMAPLLGGEAICGNMVPPAMTSSTHEVFVVFTSDESMTKPGFELQYTSSSSDVTTVPADPTTVSTSMPEAAFTWCRVLAPFGLDPPATPYIYNVRLQNVNSIYGIDFGMSGVAFNVVDKDNFDFFLLRFLDALCDSDGCIQSCIQYGYVEGGVVSMSVDDQADCRFVRLVGGPEFRLALQVTETEAKLFVNSYEQLFVASYQQPRPVETHFPLSSRVGVILPDGSENLIRYRSSQVHEI